jgi:hypothetical protein
VIRPAAVALLLGAALAGPSALAATGIQTPFPQFLPQPSTIPIPAPAPLPPPINPGYAPTAPSGLSPVLTQPGPFPAYPVPQLRTDYPPPRLPGPIDQQKIQAFSNSLYSRQIQQQLNAPDPQ